MTGKTSISWCTMTWNPLAGCTRVTRGCDNCYAFALHDRRHEIYKKFNGVYPNGTKIPEQYAEPFKEIQLLPQRLEEPLHIKSPQRIFTNSMSDLFHSQVPDSYIQQVFDVMARAHWHTFQILTKRVGRLRRLAQVLEWPSNVWMGVSIETDDLVARADVLRDVPAAVRFLSCEPLLGPLPSLNLDGLHWVIVGGESGPAYRMMEEEWATDLCDRSVDAGIPFLFKQWGGKTPKSAGRLLRGRTWNQFPDGHGGIIESSNESETLV